VSFLDPSGPFGVGCVVRELLDRSRPAHLLSDSPGRRLLLDLWYPAERGTGSESARIWEALRRDARTPALVRLLLTCLRARTVARPNARFVARAPVSSLVVYNHGLISFAAENTSLMQELASHGCTVVAIQHAEQLAEYQALNRAEPAEKKKADADLVQRLKDSTKAARPKLAVEYYKASTSTNRLVVERATDTSFVLDRIAEIVAAIPDARASSIDTSSAHLVGFSVGGAVSTETAKRDRRAKSVVNLDGGMHGTIDATGLRLPYLMLYSSANDAGNDELLPGHAQRLAPADTAHLNYHDVAGLLPILRLARVTGRTNPRAFLERRNRIVREFYSSPL
jgi:dienelactone hydrolase